MHWRYCSFELNHWYVNRNNSSLMLGASHTAIYFTTIMALQDPKRTSESVSQGFFPVPKFLRFCRSRLTIRSRYDLFNLSICSMEAKDCNTSRTMSAVPLNLYWGSRMICLSLAMTFEERRWVGLGSWSCLNLCIWKKDPICTTDALQTLVLRTEQRQCVTFPIDFWKQKSNVITISMIMKICSLDSLGLQQNFCCFII